MSTALLTGGLGFIGRHTARLLRRKGWAVVALDNASPQVHLDPQASIDAFPGSVVVGDVCDADAWAALPEYDVILHLAAETGVGQSMYAKDLYHRTNVQGTSMAARAAAQRGIPLVSLSSRAVYGQGRYECPRCGTRYGGTCCDKAAPMPSRESDPVTPTSVYGETKAAAEALTAEEPGLASWIVRPQNVIGHGQALHNPYTGVLAAFLARLREGKPLLVYGPGNQTRDFLHVADLAELLVWLIENPPPKGSSRIVNAGTGVRVSLLELAEAARAAAPVPTKDVEHLSVTRAGDIEHACADVTLLEQIGAPLPAIPAAAAVADFIQRSWDAPGGSSDLWDQALLELKQRGLTS